jgi:hypothetical protein
MNVRRLLTNLAVISALLTIAVIAWSSVQQTVEGGSNLAHVKKPWPPKAP